MFPLLRADGAGRCVICRTPRCACGGPTTTSGVDEDVIEQEGHTVGELREYETVVNGHPMVQRLSEKDAARVGGTLVGEAIPPAGEGADSAGAASPAEAAAGVSTAAAGAVATKTGARSDEDPDDQSDGQADSESGAVGAKAATAPNKARGAAGK